MKPIRKITAAVLLLALGLSLCSCVSIQASIADSIDNNMAGDKKTYEELKAGYQADWDNFLGSIKMLLGLLNEEGLDKPLDELLPSVEELLSLPEEGESAAFEGSPQEDPQINWDNLLDEQLGDVQPGNESYYSNKNPYYANNYEGECTWYAYSRFHEKTGIDLKMSRYGSGKTWLENCVDDRVTVVTDLEKIVPNSIAVDYKPNDLSHSGHVTFIEHVTYDENGLPKDVYFTECNMDSNSQFDSGTDGILKKLPFKQFINRNQNTPQYYHKVKGYIVPNE